MSHCSSKSAIRSVLHSDDLQTPKFMSFVDDSDDENEKMDFGNPENENYKGLEILI